MCCSNENMDVKEQVVVGQYNNDHNRSWRMRKACDLTTGMDPCDIILPIADCVGLCSPLIMLL